MPRTFPCPRCGKPSTWEGNAFRPFCSERCKMIDLGAWANDEYKLPTQDAPQADGGREEDEF
ncbi:DNA gyrase inhibitor YacG [Acinetobacter sp. TSRC1-2]|uniref:DNA gyrase inhibitor YacG n=1 Tax=unclassified Acinetobacter TaxID=196816 RepID=UPI003CEA52CD